MVVNTLIDDLESILQIPFVPEKVNKIRFEVPEFSMFSQMLLYPFQRLVLPEKSRSSIRPTLLVHPVINTMGFPDSGILLSPMKNNLDVLSDPIKRALIYSDAVALDMRPIVHPLRLCNNTMIGMFPSDFEEDAPLVRTIENRLVEIAEIAALIRHNVILPFVNDTIQIQRSIGGRFDPMFVNVVQANDYVAKLREEVKIYTTDAIKRPFYSAYIFQVPAIDTSKVSWDDVLSLRRDEAIFEEWRNLVHGILDQLYLKKDDFTDVGGEFKAVAEQQFREWNERLTVQRMRRTAFGALFEGGREIGIGWLGGALATAAVLASKAGAPAVTVAGLAGAAAWDAVAHAGPPMLHMLSEWWRAQSTREERISLEHHILALSFDH